MSQYFLASIIIACFLMSMGNKPKAWGFVRSFHMSLKISPNCASAHRKYKLASIFLGALMIYIVVASVLCGIAAASQKDGSLVLFSVAITCGGAPPSSVLCIYPHPTLTCSLRYQQPSSLWPLAPYNKLRVILGLDANIPLYTEHVRYLLPFFYFEW